MKYAALFLAPAFVLGANAALVDELAGTHRNWVLDQGKMAVDTIHVEKISDDIAKITIDTHGGKERGCHLEGIFQQNVMVLQLSYPDENPRRTCQMRVGAVNETVFVEDASGSCSRPGFLCGSGVRNPVNPLNRVLTPALTLRFARNSRVLPDGKAATKIAPELGQKLCFLRFFEDDFYKTQPKHPLSSLFLEVDHTLREQPEPVMMLVADRYNPEAPLEIAQFGTSGPYQVFKGRSDGVGDLARFELRNNQDGSVDFLTLDKITLEALQRRGESETLVLDPNQPSVKTMKLFPVLCGSAR